MCSCGYDGTIPKFYRVELKEEDDVSVPAMMLLYSHGFLLVLRSFLNSQSSLSCYMQGLAKVGLQLFTRKKTCRLWYCTNFINSKECHNGTVCLNAISEVLRLLAFIIYILVVCLPHSSTLGTEPVPTFAHPCVHNAFIQPQLTV